MFECVTAWWRHGNEGAADVCSRLPGHGCCLACCIFESSAFYQTFGPVGGRVLVANARTVVIIVQSYQWLQVTGRCWYLEKAASATGAPAPDEPECHHFIDLKSWTVVLGWDIALLLFLWGPAAVADRWLSFGMNGYIKNSRLIIEDVDKWYRAVSEIDSTLTEGLSVRTHRDCGGIKWIQSSKLTTSILPFIEAWAIFGNIQVKLYALNINALLYRETLQSNTLWYHCRHFCQ